MHVSASLRGRERCYALASGEVGCGCIRQCVEAVTDVLAERLRSLFQQTRCLLGLPLRCGQSAGHVVGNTRQQTRLQGLVYGGGFLRQGSCCGVVSQAQCNFKVSQQGKPQHSKVSGVSSQPCIFLEHPLGAAVQADVPVRACDMADHDAAQIQVARRLRNRQRLAQQRQARGMVDRDNALQIEGLALFTQCTGLARQTQHALRHRLSLRHATGDAVDCKLAGQCLCLAAFVSHGRKHGKSLLCQCQGLGQVLAFPETCFTQALKCAAFERRHAAATGGLECSACRRQGLRQATASEMHRQRRQMGPRLKLRRPVFARCRLGQGGHGPHVGLGLLHFHAHHIAFATLL